MSTRPDDADEPEVIAVDAIVDIPELYQEPRTKYASREEDDLRKSLDIWSNHLGKPSGLRSPLGLFPMKNIPLFASLPQYKDEYGIFDGHYRLRAEKRRGIKTLERGKDFYVDHSIRSLRDLIVRIVQANLDRKNNEWLANALYAEMLVKGEKMMTQDEIADVFHVDRTTVTKWLTMLRTLGEMAHDPFFVNVSYSLAEELTKEWEFKRLFPNRQTGLPEEQRVSVFLFNRWKEIGRVPKLRTTQQTILELHRGKSIGEALGSIGWDNSIRGAEQSLSRSLVRVNRVAQTEEQRIKAGNAEELRELLNEATKNNPKVASNERYLVEVVREDITKFGQRIPEEWRYWKGVNPDRFVLEDIPRFLINTGYALDYVIARAKARQTSEEVEGEEEDEDGGIQEVGPTKGQSLEYDANGFVKATVTGIRTSFNKKETTSS